jgi:hypothetical protein
VQPGPRALPRIIHDQPHGQCKTAPVLGGLHVIHLEHLRVPVPTDGLRAGDDHTRYTACAVITRGQAARIFMQL